MSMITEEWSHANKVGYQELLRTMLSCYGCDEYAFFTNWIAEIETREDREAVQTQMSIARELGFLQDDQKAQDLWTAWERAGMVSAGTPEASTEKDLAQACQEME